MSCRRGAGAHRVGHPPARPSAPLCLGETIWDEAQQQCVPIDDAVASVAPEPTQPSPEPSVAPTAAPSVISDIAPSEAPVASDTPSDTPSDMASPSDDPLRAGSRLSFFHTYIHSCSADRDWYTLADAASDYLRCSDDAAAGIAFRISVDGQLVAEGSGTAPGGNGSMIYTTDLPAGDITIQEVIPSGYGTPLAYCKLVSIDGQIVREGQRYLVAADGSITIEDVLNGEGIYCEWSNVPLVINPAVFINSFQCPEDSTQVAWSPMSSEFTARQSRLATSSTSRQWIATSLGGRRVPCTSSSANSEWEA